MKYLKMLGLAAVAAMALMAFAGAGSASASEICTENVNPCPAGKRIEKIEASLKGSAKLEGAGFTLDTCTAGTVKITNISGGAGVSPSGSVPVEDLTWGVKTTTPCTNPTVTNAGGTVDAAQGTEAGSTTLTGTGFEVTINNPLVGSCTYGLGTGVDLGTVKAGSDELVINAQVSKTAGGSACPNPATWNAAYTITNHTAAYFIKN